MRGAAGVAGEDAANYGDEVILLSISLSPTLLVCYVWYLQMVIHCVFLRKARDLVRDSIRKTSRKIL
jgi:flagellar biosynthesis protein FliP